METKYILLMKSTLDGDSPESGRVGKLADPAMAAAIFGFSAG